MSFVAGIQRNVIRCSHPDNVTLVDGFSMKFTTAADAESAILREELAARAIDTNAIGLATANVWMWAIESASSDPGAVIATVFGPDGLTCRELLEPDFALCPWLRLDPETARAAAVRLLTSGVSLEIAAFQDEPQAAARFASHLFAWVGNPITTYTSMEHRPDGCAIGFGVFRVPRWVDEGLVLVGPERVALLWFLGTD